MNTVGGITIPIIIVRAGDKAAIAKITSDLNTLTSVIQKVNTETAATSSVSAKAAKDQIGSIKTVEQVYKQFGQTIKETHTVIEDLGNGHKRITSDVVKDVTMWGGAFANLNRLLNQVRWAMVNVTFALAFAAAIAAPFVLATKAAVEFEEQLRKIQSISGQNYSDIGSGILSARRGTPFSRQEVGDVFLELLKAGQSADEAMSTLPSVLTLAKVGFMEAGDAAFRLTQILFQFNIAAEDSQKVVDIISTVADNTRASIESLTSSMAYVGSVAESAGQDFLNTTVLLGELSQAGMDGTKAGTSLRQALNSLIDPSEKAQKAMNRIGVSFIESTGQAKEMSSFIVELNSALSGLSEGERLDTLGEMFEVRALTAVMALINRVDALGGTFAGAAEAADVTGRATIKSFIQQESSAVSFKAALEDIKDAFLGIGDASNEALVKPTIGFMKYLKNVGEHYSEARDEQRRLSDEFMAENNMGFGGTSFIGVDQYLSLTKAFALADLYSKDYKEAMSDIVDYHEQMVSLASEQFEVAQNIVGIYKESPGLAAINTDFGSLGSRISEIVSHYQRLRQVQDEAGKALQEAEAAFRTSTGADRDKALIAYTDAAEKARDAQLQVTIALRELDEVARLAGSGFEDFKTRLVNAQNALYKFDSAAAIVKNQFGEDFFAGLLGETTLMSYKLKDMKSNLETAVSSMRSDPILEGLMGVDQLASLSSRFNELYSDIVSNEEAIKQLTLNKELLDKEIKVLNKSLKEEQNVLKNLNDQLKETNKRISELSSARFDGESKTLSVLKKAEIFRKQQELATYGVADASAFIHEALQLEISDYDQLFERLSKINSEMDRNQSVFEAWQETIKTAIRAEIEAGENLSVDVTNRVKQWQTALLSTSQFGGDSGGSAFDDFVNKLQLAYDVHFGGMRNEVNDFLQQQKDREIGVFSSSEQLIAALQREMYTRDTLTASIVNQEAVISGISKRLETKTLALEGVLDDIASKKDGIMAAVNAISLLGTSIDNAISRINTAINALNDTSGGRGIPGVNYSPLPGTSTIFNNNNSGGRGIPGVNNSGADIRPLSELLAMRSNYTPYGPFNDFLIRPGMKPVTFSPDDTIIGVKDTNNIGGSSVSIGAINVSGYNKDPEELAYEVAKAISRELSAR